MNVKISKSLTCQSEGMGLVTRQLVLLVLHDCPWSFCICSWFRFRVILYYTVIKPFPSALWTPRKSQQQTIALWFSEKQILAVQYEDRDITHVRIDQNKSYSVVFLLRTHRSDSCDTHCSDSSETTYLLRRFSLFTKNSSSLQYQNSHTYRS